MLGADPPCQEHKRETREKEDGIRSNSTPYPAVQALLFCLFTSDAQAMTMAMLVSPGTRDHPCRGVTCLSRRRTMQVCISPWIWIYAYAWSSSPWTGSSSGPGRLTRLVPRSHFLPGHPSLVSCAASRPSRPHFSAPPCPGRDGLLFRTPSFSPPAALCLGPLFRPIRRQTRDDGHHGDPRDDCRGDSRYIVHDLCHLFRTAACAEVGEPSGTT